MLLHHVLSSFPGLVHSRPETAAVVGSDSKKLVDFFELGSRILTGEQSGLKREWPSTPTVRILDSAAMFSIPNNSPTGILPLTAMSLMHVLMHSECPELSGNDDEGGATRDVIFDIRPRAVVPRVSVGKGFFPSTSGVFGRVPTPALKGTICASGQRVIVGGKLFAVVSLSMEDFLAWREGIKDGKCTCDACPFACRSNRSGAGSKGPGGSIATCAEVRLRAVVVAPGVLHESPDDVSRFLEAVVPEQECDRPSVVLETYNLVAESSLGVFLRIARAVTWGDADVTGVTHLDDLVECVAKRLMPPRGCAPQAEARVVGENIRGLRDALRSDSDDRDVPPPVRDFLDLMTHTYTLHFSRECGTSCMTHVGPTPPSAPSRAGVQRALSRDIFDWPASSSSVSHGALLDQGMVDPSCSGSALQWRDDPRAMIRQMVAWAQLPKLWVSSHRATRIFKASEFPVVDGGFDASLLCDKGAQPAAKRSKAGAKRRTTCPIPVKTRFPPAEQGALARASVDTPYPRLLVMEFLWLTYARVRGWGVPSTKEWVPFGHMRAVLLQYAKSHGLQSLPLSSSQAPRAPRTAARNSDNSSSDDDDGDDDNDDDGGAPSGTGSRAGAVRRGGGSRVSPCRRKRSLARRRERYSKTQKRRAAPPESPRPRTDVPRSTGVEHASRLESRDGDDGGSPRPLLEPGVRSVHGRREPVIAEVPVPRPPAHGPGPSRGDNGASAADDDDDDGDDAGHGTEGRSPSRHRTVLGSAVAPSADAPVVSSSGAASATASGGPAESCGVATAQCPSETARSSGPALSSASTSAEPTAMASSRPPIRGPSSTGGVPGGRLSTSAPSHAEGNAAPGAPSGDPPHVHGGRPPVSAGEPSSSPSAWRVANCVSGGTEQGVVAPSLSTAAQLRPLGFPSASGAEAHSSVASGDQRSSGVGGEVASSGDGNPGLSDAMLDQLIQGLEPSPGVSGMWPAFVPDGDMPAFVPSSPMFNSPRRGPPTQDGTCVNHGGGGVSTSAAYARVVHQPVAQTVSGTYTTTSAPSYDMQAVPAQSHAGAPVMTHGGQGWSAPAAPVRSLAAPPQWESALEPAFKQIHPSDAMQHINELGVLVACVLVREIEPTMKCSGDAPLPAVDPGISDSVKEILSWSSANQASFESMAWEPVLPTRERLDHSLARYSIVFTRSCVLARVISDANDEAWQPVMNRLAWLSERICAPAASAASD